ncbi:MAG: Gfo/Idh/MocA family oxidoreductase [bacterium]|nr:Gfo/Idh/MocA family oxidoreductase [bacterium]
MAGEQVLVVGAGGISTAWFPPIKEEQLQVCGVVDLKPEVARERLAAYQIEAPVFATLAGALKKTRPDFVLDLTVPDAHCAVTCAALHRGIPVIGEKPMAASMAQARRMLRAAEAHKTLYMVSQSRRWTGHHATIVQAVRNGVLGPLTTLNCDFYIGAHFGGFRDAMASPLILDMAIHLFDLARLFSGADAQAVYTKEFNPRGSWYQGNAAATCVFEMDHGIIFTFRGSWCAEGCHTSWNGNWRVIGEHGTLVYDHDQEPHGQVVAGSDGFNRTLRDACLPPAAMPYGGMHGALREMLAYLRTGAPPQTECHDNIKSLAMVFTAIKSARTGRRVAVTA